MIFPWILLFIILIRTLYQNCQLLSQPSNVGGLLWHDFLIHFMVTVESRVINHTFMTMTGWYWSMILSCCSYAVPLSTVQNAGMLERSAWLAYPSTVWLWVSALCGGGSASQFAAFATWQLWKSQHLWCWFGYSWWYVSAGFFSTQQVDV